MDNENYLNDEYGLKDIHEQLLTILKDIHSFCQDRGIEYSLNGGTALGAIRHGGFIPWDDDADVMFDRENYNRFISEFEDPRYEIEKKMWVYRVKRIDYDDDQPCVDLFVFDNVPNNKMMGKIKIALLKFIQGMLKTNPDYSQFGLGYRICLKITGIIGKLMTHKAKLKLYDKVSQIGNGKKTEKICIYNNFFRFLSVMWPADVMESVQLCKFEDTHLAITSNYNKYLTASYGDYMKLPPKEKRVPEHSRRMKP